MGEYKISQKKRQQTSTVASTWVLGARELLVSGGWWRLTVQWQVESIEWRVEWQDAEWRGSWKALALSLSVGRRKCPRLLFYLEPASDMPILTLEGQVWPGSLKDRLYQAEGTPRFGLQTCFMGSCWLRHTRVRPAGLVEPWLRALPLEVSTWLDSHCLCFGI